MAALGVTPCCALQLVLAFFGLGTAASMTMIGAWIEPHKGPVNIVAGVGIAAGFLLAYHLRKDQYCIMQACWHREREPYEYSDVAGVFSRGGSL
jgi:hypothetical protein